MRKHPHLLMTLLLAPLALASTQAPVNGTWKIEGVGRGLPWEVVLRTDGPNTLIGAVSSCGSGGRPVEIANGRIDGDTISFQCTSVDGQRTITFRGALTGGGIAFHWEMQPKNDPWAQGLFRASSPPSFTVKRAAETADAVSAVADRTRRRPAVTFDRILHPNREPQNWLTYSGNESGHRYSPLAQITPDTVKHLELAWIWQTSSKARFEATPLVVDGVLYTVLPPNDVAAVDAATGRVLWTYAYTPSPRAVASGGGGRPNRGLAILDDKLFLATLDAHLLAIDAYAGTLVWDTKVADASDPACGGTNCYVMTLAPLAVKDKIMVGVGGSEGPIRGFIAAFNAATGKQEWRFHTIPGPGEPGGQTWPGDSWKTGGGGVWNTGAYDPDLNLTYWGVGNPSPPWDGQTRIGDNLYSDSIVALDADSGRLRWHYQFTPHDTRDWDACQVPVLVDLDWQGRRRKGLLSANRNGLLYALDRSTGDFLYGKPFVEVNWMDGFDASGRPREVSPRTIASRSPLILPGSGTNWYPPSFSASTSLFYIPAWERGTVGGIMQRPSAAYGALRAFDPQTGKQKWEFRRDNAIFSSGVLSTASGLLFTGVSGDYYSGEDAARLADGYFYALDARSGNLLWQMALPWSVTSGPMSYSVAGKQFVAVAAGNTLFVFALRQ